MSAPSSGGDFDVPGWVFAIARALGMSEIRLRWKLRAWHRRWVWLRRELVPPSRRFEHQICPSCGAVQDRLGKTCGSCGERLGSSATSTLRALGLSIPTAVSVSSLVGVALIAVLTGVVANVASAYLGHGAVSAGASGALMGLIGVAAGWGQRSGTTIGRDVRNQMLKWGGYTMVFGFFIGADNIAHGVGFISGGLLGFTFRPETLRHTKAGAPSVAMGIVGALSALATTALALVPPAASHVTGAAFARENEPSIVAGDDAEAP